MPFFFCFDAAAADDDGRRREEDGLSLSIGGKPKHPMSSKSMMKSVVVRIVSVGLGGRGQGELVGPQRDQLVGSPLVSKLVHFISESLSPRRYDDDSRLFLHAFTLL